MIVYETAFVVTPHASNPNSYDALLITTTSGAGSVTVTSEQGASQALAAIPARTIIPIRTRLVTAAGGTGVKVVGLNSPVEAPFFNSAAAVNKHDTNPNVFDALYISATGDGALNVVPLMNGAVVAFTALVAGMILPVRTRLVMTGGTATAVGLRF